MSYANELMRLLEQTLERWRVPAGQVAGQLGGGNLPPAGTGVPYAAAAHALTGAAHTATGLTTGQVLRATGATAFAFGALDLGNADAVTGTLSPARGGTGVSNGTNALTIPATGTAALGTGAAGHVAYWSGTNTLTGEAALQWDATNDRLGIGVTPSHPLHLSAAVNARAAYLLNTYTASTTAQHLPLAANTELDVTVNDATDTSSQYTALGMTLRYRGTAGLTNANNRAGQALLVSAFYTNTGITNTIDGLYMDVRNNGAGTVTDMSALRIIAPVNNGGGTVTTLYGLRIGNVTVGATNYAIYTGSGTIHFGGNVGLSQTTFGTSATNTLALANGTAPGSSPTDAAQLYSADIAAGNAALHTRTELGHLIKLYRITGWGAPTGTPTRTTFATGSVTTAQLAERVKALIDDLTLIGLIGA